MRLRIFVLLTVVNLLSCNVFSQDVWLQNFFSPSSGCSLSNGELVNVLINNNSGSVMAANTINVSYSVDGGSSVNQLLSANLLPGASWSFNFSTNADLSVCGAHTMKVWVTRAGDANQLNDTLLWVVQNDCPVIPGQILSDTTVCQGTNSGTLVLDGWSNGTILGWEYSVDNGATWSSTGVTSLSYNFSNLTQETVYQVVLDGGNCIKDTSGIATVRVQPPVNPGTLLGSDSMCVTSVSGSLNLVGASAAALWWEFSTNNGASWGIISNTTNTQNYSGLPSTTLYRVYLDGVACPSVYSGTATIFVEQLTSPATLVGSDSLCALSASGTITATGPIAPVGYWQSSTNNGASWSIISNTTPTLNYTNLPTTTWYRVYTYGVYCPSHFSDTAVVFVQPSPPPPGITASNDSLCSTSANGVLSLTGVTTPVLGWQYSTNNGANWTPIANTTNFHIFSGLTTTTWFRAIVEGDLCPDVYSQTAVIFVQPVTGPGTITGSDTLCFNSASGALNITGNIGTVSFWESSTDGGATWTTINNTTTTENYSNLTDDTWYRAYTDGGVCPSFYTDTALIHLDTFLIPATVLGSNNLCNTGASGQLIATNFTGNILYWEASADDGASWNTINFPTDSLPYLNVVGTTWYRVFTGGSACGGTYSDTAILSVDAMTSAGTLQNNMIVCTGDSFELNLNGYTANFIEWQNSTDGTTWTPMSGVTSSSYVDSNLTSTMYYQVVLQNGVCPPDTTNIVEVTLLPPPVVDAGPDVTIMIDDTTLLIASGGVSGFWSPGLTLSDSLIPTPLAFPTATTTYVYYMVDANGCPNSDTVTVTVEIPTLFDIKNVITANNDNYNDTWIIEGVEYYPGTSVVVFNIYGKEVYASSDYQNDWRGTYKDQQLPNGTYYYVVVPGGSETRLKGNITIMGDE
jgi:gliding motility-associated-like protein